MNLQSALAICLLAFSSLSAFAEEFPEGAVPLPPAEVTRQFSGKVFAVRLKDGAAWRFDFRSNGFFFFNHSAGPSDSGPWRVEESRLCIDGRRLIQPSCNEVRMKDAELLLKRDNGDVVEFIEKP